jgi:excisionase family DNA binding protein
MTIQNRQNLLTYRDVAQILGLKENTLRVWVSARRIPFVKLGSAVRFTPKMVDEIIEKSTRGAIT